MPTKPGSFILTCLRKRSRWAAAGREITRNVARARRVTEEVQLTIPCFRLASAELRPYEQALFPWARGHLAPATEALLVDLTLSQYLENDTTEYSCIAISGFLVFIGCSLFALLSLTFAISFIFTDM